jgi:hypothetical protein
VTLRLKNISALNALDLLIGQFDLFRTCREKTILITTPWGIPGPVITRRYNVETLLRRRADYPGKIRDIFRAYTDPRDFPPPRRSSTLGDLKALVETEIAPGSWISSDCDITLEGAILKVTHTEEVHGEVRRLLWNLSCLTGPEILIHVNVLRVPLAAVAGCKPCARIDEETAGRLSAAAAALPQPFGTHRMSTGNGQRSHVALGEEFVFKTGREGDMFEKRKARDGVVIDVQPFFAGGERVPAFVRVYCGRAARLFPAAPRLPFFRCETVAEIPRKGALLLLGGADPFPKATDEKGTTVLAVMLRAEPGRWEPLDLPGYVLSSENDRIFDILHNLRLTVEYQEVSMETILEDLAKRLTVNFVVHPEIYRKYAEPWLHVKHLSLTNLPADQVLEALFQQKCLHFQIRSGAVVVLAQGQTLKTPMAGKDFPVMDILLPPPVPHPPPFLRFATIFPEAGFFFIGDKGPKPITEKSLIRCVRQMVSPESWEVHPNHIRMRRTRLIVWNRPDVLRGVKGLLDSLRARLWDGVVLEGIFITGLPGGKGKGPVGPTLSAHACDALEKALAGGTREVLGRFRLPAVTDRRVTVALGSQTVHVRNWEEDSIWTTTAVLDGWAFSGKVSSGLRGRRVALKGMASLSRYLRPEAPRSETGRLANLTFRADLQLFRGEGAILGALPSAGKAGGEAYLFLRVR